MSYLKLFLLSFVCCLAVYLPVEAQIAYTRDYTVKVTNHPLLGKILTDDRGMTLYIFTGDKNNTSTCYDQCATEWPPLLLDAGDPRTSPDVAGKVEISNRRDNTRQVVYNGMPLYYYHKDKKPGDAFGQEVDHKWYVVTPHKGPMD